MTHNQRARINAYTVSLACLAENRELFSEEPAFDKNFQAARQLLDDIDAISIRRAEKLAGVTNKAQEQLDQLATQAMELASAIVNYADSEGDLQLKEIMNFSFTELRYAGDMLLKEKCNTILDIARSLGPALEEYGVTNITVFNLQVTVHRYANLLKTSSGQAILPKYALLKLKETLRLLNGIFLEKLDTMAKKYKGSNPEFYNQYLNRRAIVNPGPRSTRIAGRVVAKAGYTELSKVFICVEGTSLCVISNEDGTYVIKSPVREKVTVVFKKEGFKTARAEVFVKTGKATPMDMVMEEI